MSPSPIRHSTGVDSSAYPFHGKTEDQELIHALDHLVARFLQDEGFGEADLMALVEDVEHMLLRPFTEMPHHKSFPGREITDEKSAVTKRWGFTQILDSVDVDSFRCQSRRRLRYSRDWCRVSGSLPRWRSWILLHLVEASVFHQERLVD